MSVPRSAPQVNLITWLWLLKPYWLPMTMKINSRCLLWPSKYMIWALLIRILSLTLFFLQPHWPQAEWLVPLLSFKSQIQCQFFREDFLKYPVFLQLLFIILPCLIFSRHNIYQNQIIVPNIYYLSVSSSSINVRTLSVLTTIFPVLSTIPGI